MRKNEPISKLMSSKVVTVHLADPVSKVRKLIEEHKVHHLPVVQGSDLVGIISWTDLMRVSFGEFGNQDGKQLDSILDHTYKIADLMVANPKSLPMTGTIREAARILRDGEFHALPVVDGIKLVGIVTSTDLLAYLAEL
jgi:CBS domain-containing protein